jgi:hypothetical protein
MYSGYRWSVHLKFECPKCKQSHEKMLIVFADTRREAGEKAAKEPLTCDTYQTAIDVRVNLSISAETSDRKPIADASELSGRAGDKADTSDRKASERKTASSESDK